jgi:DNA-binding transcriptional LysR family regulator
VARRIAPIRGVVVASPAYLELHGRPRTPDDLTKHEALLQTARGDIKVWQFRRGRRTVSVRPEGRFRADNGEAILQAALAGLGVAMMPTFLVSSALESGALEPLLGEYELPEAGLYVVRPPGTHVPGKVRALTDLLVERFGGEPYWDQCQMRMHAAAQATQRSGQCAIAKAPAAGA